jgi:2-phospho-L-lactate guanylyltransferase
MTIWAIIPVKTLRHAKSRLAPFLEEGERAALMRHLLHRLLHVLSGVPQINNVVVVSRDAEVASIAHQHLAHIVAEQEGCGLNESVTTGASYALHNGARSVLILPADLPIVMAEDIQQMVGETAVSPTHAMIICSDREQNGTNALLIPAHVPFRYQYGVQSLQKHVAEAARLQMNMRIVELPGLQFDLDTFRDWNEYQAQREWR